MGVSTEREKTLNQVQTPRQDEVNRSGLPPPGRLGETDTAVVGFTSPVPPVTFRTPPISVSATLLETLQLPVSRCAVSVTHQSGTNTVTRRDDKRRMPVPGRVGVRDIALGDG